MIHLHKATKALELDKRLAAGAKAGACAFGVDDDPEASVDEIVASS
jgi:hypothetical protein